MGQIISKITHKKVNLEEEELDGKSRIKISKAPPVLKTLNVNKKVDAMLKLNDIQSPALQAVFQKNMPALLNEIDKLQASENGESFQHQLLIIFWFAIHLENLEIVEQLVDQHRILKKLVACGLQKKTDDFYDEDDNEWDVEDGNRSQFQQQDSDGFSSNKLSEEEKEGPAANGYQDDDVFHEGGSSDNDSFFQDEKSPRGQTEHADQVPALNNSIADVGSAQKLNDRDDSLVEHKSSKNQADIRNNISDDLKQYEGLSLGELLGQLKKKKLEEENRLATAAQKLQEPTIDFQKEFEAKGITDKVIDKTVVNDISTLIQIKMSFRGKFQNMMTNILKIALQHEEEKLSCIIVAYYEISLEVDMIVRALTHSNYHFLMFVWAFDKNYLGNRHQQDPCFITFQQLFDLIKRQFRGDVLLVNTKIIQVLEWKIMSKDNILIALLAHHFDALAIQYMGYYSHFLDKNLFIYCITHGNNIFLQEALLLSAFDKSLFREESVISEVLAILKEGYRTNFLMNILTLIDFSVWKNKHLKEIIDIINDYVEENYDKNRLLLSPNPLMSITLASEMLNKIAQSRRKFDNECFKIKTKLLELGKMYSAKIVDEKYYEKLIMGVDFKDRTVLKTITQNSFEPLMDEDDPKAENLMLMIWHGKEATKCDGNIYGFSNLSHILVTKAKKVSGKRSTLFQMVANYFEPNFNVDYTYQYKYRSKAISFYFAKEFLCALVMLIIFQYINYKYLVLFSTETIEGTSAQLSSSDVVTYALADYPASFYSSTPTTTTTTTNTTNSTKTSNTTATLTSGSTNSSYSVTVGTTITSSKSAIEVVIASIRTYVSWNSLALFFAVALLFQLLLKVMYNLCSKKKIKFDKWTIMDSLSAVLFIAAVELVSRVSPETLLDPSSKSSVDYFMIVVLGISWLRFFVYFLVVRTISKLLLTLIAMIKDTLAFMFIMGCFILIMSSIFTTLYQDTNPEKFGGLALTIRTLFGAALAQYDYDGMGNRILSFSILQMVHVFFANILLMNYLIAILSTTYDNMKQTGIFMYKVNLYQYCERFMIAFENKAYGEIVLHPPPLSYLSILMTPFLVSEVAMLHVSKFFSYMMFWLENVIYIVGFFLYELLLFPLAYIKIWWNILWNSSGVLNIIVNAIVFGLIGLPLTLFLVCRDCSYLIRILSYHQGCRQGRYDDLTTEDVDRAMRARIYNETRVTVVSLYKRLQRHMKADEDQEEDQDSQDNFRVDDDLDFFKVQDDEHMNEDFLYVVKKSLIIEEWKKTRYIIERKQKVKAKKIASKSAGLLQNILEASFKRKLGGPGQVGASNLSPSPKRVPGSKRNSPVARSQVPDSKGTRQPKIVFLDVLAKNMNDESDDDDIEIDMSDFAIKDEEVKVVDEFLTKFTIVSESSMNEHLDIMLMLKALPNKITDHILDDTEQFSFRTFQESLIAFQNLEIVNAFEYFDDKNRERVQNVKDKLVNQKSNLSEVKEILDMVRQAIEKNEEHFLKKESQVAQPATFKNNINNISSSPTKQQENESTNPFKSGATGQMPSIDLINNAQIQTKGPDNIPQFEMVNANGNFASPRQGGGTNKNNSSGRGAKAPPFDAFKAKSPLSVANKAALKGPLNNSLLK